MEKEQDAVSKPDFPTKSLPEDAGDTPKRTDEDKTEGKASIGNFWVRRLSIMRTWR